MTWLSRLLPQSRSLQRHADHNRDRRARQGRRHSRTVNLEWLEQRTLLAGNVSIPTPPATPGVLVINLDSHSDHININENGGSSVTVTGLNHTAINGTFVPQTFTEVTSIVVRDPSTSGQDSPVISLTESPGVSSGIGAVTFFVGSQHAPPAPAGPDLTLTVTGVKNTGALTVLDIPGGTLSATVTHSQFSSIFIEQENCCPGTVVLDNDVSGTTTVSLGWARGDSITFHNDNFGSTTFELGNGPNPNIPNCDNGGSTISGDDSNFRNLTLIEPLGGSNQTISVGTAKSDVEVSLTSFGIVARQGGGNNDSIQMVSITTSGQPSNSVLPDDSILTEQGDGNNDTVVVDSSTVLGNILSFQGNGAQDQAYFFGDTAGFSLLIGGVFLDEFNGLEEIVQGNGDNDFAWLDCGRIENVGRANVANNVTISQGAAIFTPGCSQQFGDRIDVQWTNVGSDMILEQGENDTTGADLGANIIQIATPTDLGSPVGNSFAESFNHGSAFDPGTPVVVGSATIIDEIGANNGGNSIIMGGIGGTSSIYDGGVGNPDSGRVDFETGTLDVFTGLGGGAFVSVQNTAVINGNLGLFGAFNFNSGGSTGNIAVIDSNSFSGTGFTTPPSSAAGGITFDGGFVVLIIT